MTRGQVAKLRDTAEELYIAASKLSEDRHKSETFTTGQERRCSFTRMGAVTASYKSRPAAVAGRTGTDDFGGMIPSPPLATGEVTLGGRTMLVPIKHSRQCSLRQIALVPCIKGAYY